MAEWATYATEAGADLVCFLEPAIIGDSPRDLVLRPGFVRDNLLAPDRLARATASGSVGMSVCEDAWHEGLLFSEYEGVRAIANINGFLYHRDKTGERADVLRDRARETGAWIVYVNAVGGQDELIFDGGSMVVAPDGSI